MSTLYSHPEFPNRGPEQINQELMRSVSSNPLRLLLPQHVTNYIQALWSKKAQGQPVTFADIFGMLIGETLIPAVSTQTLSHKLLILLNALKIFLYKCMGECVCVCMCDVCVWVVNVDCDQHVCIHRPLLYGHLALSLCEWPSLELFCFLSLYCANR